MLIHLGQLDESTSATSINQLVQKACGSVLQELEEAQLLHVSPDVWATSMLGADSGDSDYGASRGL